MKIYEILFLIAGLGMLLSLPWIEGSGFYFWTAAKLAYFTGILFFVVNIIKNARKNKNVWN